MTARLVLPGTVTEAEWLAARRQGITASEIATVMGLAPGTQNSAYKLYHQKTGDLPPDDLSDVMERGKVLEPYVVTKFLERYPKFNVTGDGRTLYTHPDRAWQMCTPDRLLFDDEGANVGHAHPDSPRARDPLAGLECKTDGFCDPQRWGEDGSDRIPVHYALQVYWCMDVFGIGTWYLACQFMTPWHCRIYEITMNDQIAAILKQAREEARDFLDRIDYGDPPPVDWAPATTEALKQLHPELKDETAVVPKRMAAAWVAAGARLRAAEKAKKRLENQLRERAGAAAHIALKDGTAVATRQKYPVKETKLREYEVDKLVPARRPATPTEEDPT